MTDTIVTTMTTDPATSSARTDFYEQARAVSPLVVADTTFGRFILPSRRVGLGRSVFVDREHHRELVALSSAVRLLRRHRGATWPSGLDIVDTGAELGLRSVAALTSHGFDRAVALEPDVELARFVRMNARLNDCHARIRVAPVSVGSAAGDTSARACETVTLDRLAERGLYDPSTVGLTWFGASGSILAALAGAQSLISRAVPLVIEVGPELRERAERDALVTALDGRYRHATTVGQDTGPLAALDSLKVTEPDGSHLLLTSFD